MNFTDNGIEGFDISFYQDDNTTPQGIDFVKMKNYGADFVIVRAGQNVWVDQDFHANWAAAKAGSPLDQIRTFTEVLPTHSRRMTLLSLWKE